MVIKAHTNALHVDWLRDKLDAGSVVVAIGDKLCSFRMAALSVRLAKAIRSNDLNWVQPPYDFDKPESWPPFGPQEVWDSVETLTGMTDAQLRVHGVPQPGIFFAKVVLVAAVMRSLNINRILHVPTTGTTLGMVTDTQLWTA